MKSFRNCFVSGAVVLFVVCFLPLSAVSRAVSLAVSQESATVLTTADLSRVVPTGFYFQGRSAPTQMRNAAAARWGNNRYVIAGIVDTSGYAADVRAKYEGFLITDSEITLNGESLRTGAYGFGFSNDGNLNIMDLAGNQILSVSSTKDSKLRRPRPLMMSLDGDRVRLYNGRYYVIISVK
jgi:NurA-like 5'-3' nuclease